MKNKILFLIDGSSLLSTSFYGNLPKEYFMSKTEEEKNKALLKVLKTSTGIYTNGMYTMMKKIEDIIKKINPEYMAVAWDVTRNTFRRTLYEDYKANRNETPNILKEQFKTTQDLLENINIPCFAFNEYEADDVLGTLSYKFKDDIKVVILTKDQDALQLINDNVSVWLMTSKSDELYKKRDIKYKEFNIIDGVFCYNSLTFKEEYGFDPIQIIDYKALVGDTSDNIPGVKGVGDKSAIPLLQEFYDLETLYSYLENTEEKILKELGKDLEIKRFPLKSLKENKDNAYLSKKLATIKIDIPELKNISLEQLKLNIDQSKKNEEYKKYEFKSLLK